MTDDTRLQFKIEECSADLFSGYVKHGDSIFGTVTAIYSGDEWTVSSNDRIPDLGLTEQGLVGTVLGRTTTTAQAALHRIVTEAFVHASAERLLEASDALIKVRRKRDSLSQEAERMREAAAARIAEEIRRFDEGGFRTSMPGSPSPEDETKAEAQSSIIQEEREAGKRLQFAEIEYEHALNVLRDALDWHNGLSDDRRPVRSAVWPKLTYIDPSYIRNAAARLLEASDLLAEVRREREVELRRLGGMPKNEVLGQRYEVAHRVLVALAAYKRAEEEDEEEPARTAAAERVWDIIHPEDRLPFVTNAYESHCSAFLAVVSPACPRCRDPIHPVAERMGRCACRLGGKWMWSGVRY